MNCNLCKYYKRGCYYCYLKDMDVKPDGWCESYSKRYFPAPEEPWCASYEDEDEDGDWDD